MVAGFVIGKAFLGGDQAFVAADAAVGAREEGEAFFQRQRQLLLVVIERFAGGVNLFGVVSQGFGEVFKDAQIIDDQAVLLAGRVKSIGAAHGLGQRLVADGFIQVHAVANGRVEAGEQLGSYYEDFQRVAGVAVAVEHSFLLAGLRVYGLPALEGGWVERQAELAPAAYYLVQTKAPSLTLTKICSLRRFGGLSAYTLLSQINDFTVLQRIQSLRHTVSAIAYV